MQSLPKHSSCLICGSGDTPGTGVGWYAPDDIDIYAEVMLNEDNLIWRQDLKIRYLGHSCVEIIGKHHILIDPDFTRNPDPGVEYICITHAHKDHIGRAVDVPEGIVLAAADVCEIAASLGVPRERLRPVVSEEQVSNIQVLPGYSRVNDPIYTFFSLLFRWRFPDPGGTPLSFLVQDEADLLHIGDAHEATLPIYPDILCLPWRSMPLGSKHYKDALIRMASRFAAPYILPIHRDLPGSEADPRQITRHIHATVLEGKEWYCFRERKRRIGSCR